ncbi:terminase large subunit domain-containing protein [Sphingobacterium sp. 1.A.5]|uniref:terminase large subunit domain-containing protein n=1 Tax=Sphingobacterium sp. 1.A.5 TaxID=2044604 RepID=UPI0011817E33|nr:terminase family protein [Sphingobacterium sp. 1.A.5]
MKQRLILPNPHKGQLKFLKSKAKRKVLMCGRRWGKSLICKSLAIQGALDKKLIAFVTPTFALGKVFYKELLDTIGSELIEESNQTDLYIKLITGGSIRFFTGEAPDNFRGHKFHLAILDECAYIKSLKNFFFECVNPCLTDFNGDAIFLSTPRGQGEFFQFYNYGLSSELKYKNWESFHYSTYDNPHLDRSVIEEAKAELPEMVFAQEYLAIPQANASNPFGNHIAKNIIPTLSRKKDKAIGIDLASTVDWSVVIGLTDENGVATMCRLQRWQSDWNDTKMKLKDLPRSVDKIVDSTGVGMPIFDELRLDIPNLYGFKFTKASKPQLIKELILAVEQGKIRYCEEVSNEMLNFEYIYSSESNTIKYQAISGHDDQVIALALSWHMYNKRTRKSNSWCIGTA